MSSSTPLPSINAPSPTILPAQDDLDLSTADTFDTDSLGLSPYRALNEKNLTPRRQPPTLNDIFTSPNRVSPRSDLNTVSENGDTMIHSNGTVPANDSPEIIRNPFNFQTQSYTVNKGPMSPSRADGFAAVGRRRGHKYARSSISHQIILEPTPRTTPLLLPTNLPIPTFKEFRASMTREQSLRWLWCLTHLAIAAYTQTLAHNSGGSLALTALSHLLFFDTLGAFLCVAVDVGRNFEVWSRSSIRHPFGLQRAEVIAGLAMAIILLFMGLDITNHGLQHFLENKGDHEPHHVHRHKVPGAEPGGAHAAAGPGMVVGGPEGGPAKGLLDVVNRLSVSSVDLVALLAVSSTLISAFMLRNHARIGKSLKLNLPSFVPPVLRNPSHLLTLSCSGLLLLIPFLSGATYTLYDTGLGVIMAIAMITLGGRLCLSLGRMLLMSFPHGGGKRDSAPHSFLSSVATPATATRATFSPTATHFTPVKANRPAFTPSTPTASSFPSSSSTSASLIPRILALSPEIRSIISLQLFQVHHTLCVAAVKVMLRPEYCYGLQITNDEVRDRVRGRIVTFLEEFVGPGVKPAASVVKSGKGGMTSQDAADVSNSYRFRWEVTVQIEVER